MPYGRRCFLRRLIASVHRPTPVSPSVQQYWSSHPAEMASARNLVRLEDNLCRPVQVDMWPGKIKAP